MACEEESASAAGKSTEAVKFDPAIHLVADPLTPDTPSADMGMLGLPESPLSPIAFTGPFPLLTEEAVNLHRHAVLDPEVLTYCMTQTWAASVQIRGVAPAFSRFIYDFWNSDEVKQTVSRAAGVELEPVMDYEICHVNVQVDPQKRESPFQQVYGLTKEVSSAVTVEDDDKSFEEEDSSSERTVVGDDNMVVEWHKDSYPFVVIVMLSNPRSMSGGETVIEKGDGSHMYVKAPTVGQALVFQGGQIRHAALPTVNAAERITMVTSFRHKVSVPMPLICDMSNLRNVRRYSNLSELDYQWTIASFDMVIKSMQYKRKQVKELYEQSVTQGNGQKGFIGFPIVDPDEIKTFVGSVVKYLNKMAQEMAPESHEGD